MSNIENRTLPGGTLDLNEELEISSRIQDPFPSRANITLSTCSTHILRPKGYLANTGPKDINPYTIRSWDVFQMAIYVAEISSEPEAHAITASKISGDIFLSLIEDDIQDERFCDKTRDALHMMFTVIRHNDTPITRSNRHSRIDTLFPELTIEHLTPDSFLTPTISSPQVEVPPWNFDSLQPAVFSFREEDVLVSVLDGDIEGFFSLLFPSTTAVELNHASRMGNIESPADAILDSFEDDILSACDLLWSPFDLVGDQEAPESSIAIHRRTSDEPSTVGIMQNTLPSDLDEGINSISALTPLNQILEKTLPSSESGPQEATVLNDSIDSVAKCFDQASHLAPLESSRVITGRHLHGDTGQSIAPVGHDLGDRETHPEDIDATSVVPSLSTSPTVPCVLGDSGQLPTPRSPTNPRTNGDPVMNIASPKFNSSLGVSPQRSVSDMETHVPVNENLDALHLPFIANGIQAVNLPSDGSPHGDTEPGALFSGCSSQSVPPSISLSFSPSFSVLELSPLFSSDRFDNNSTGGKLDPPPKPGCGARKPPGSTLLNSDANSMHQSISAHKLSQRTLFPVNTGPRSRSSVHTPLAAAASSRQKQKQPGTGPQDLRASGCDKRNSGEPSPEVYLRNKKRHSESAQKHKLERSQTKSKSRSSIVTGTRTLSADDTSRTLSVIWALFSPSGFLSDDRSPAPVLTGDNDISRSLTNLYEGIPELQAVFHLH